MSLSREQVVQYLKGQGYPHPEEEDAALLDLFLNANEVYGGQVRGVDWQAMFDEAVINNYAMCDVDRWCNIVRCVRMPMKFVTAMAIGNALYEHEDVDSLELPGGDEVVCEMAIDRWMDRQGIELSNAEYFSLRAVAYQNVGVIFEGPGFDMLLHEKMNGMQKKAQGVHFGIGANLEHPTGAMSHVGVSCFDTDLVRCKKRAMDMLALEAKANGWQEHGYGCDGVPYVASMFVCSFEGDKCLDYVERDEASVLLKFGKLVIEESLESAIDSATLKSELHNGDCGLEHIEPCLE